MSSVDHLKDHCESSSSLRDITAHEVNNSDKPQVNQSKRKPIPPPVLPKTVRKTSRGSLERNYQNHAQVSICITNEKETEYEAKYRETEAALRTMREERDNLKKQVAQFKAEIQENHSVMKKAQSKLNRYDMTSKAKRVQDDLKMWTQAQPSIPDLNAPMPHDELADPQELIKQFIESERLYLNCLQAVDYHFYQPIKMFSIFKHDILTTQQLQGLFFNSPQLLVIHRLFYEQLVHLCYLPKESRLEEFVISLERFAPSFSMYAGFQSEHFMVNLQRELTHCQSKPQFTVLLDNLNQRCEGKTLVDLLRLIAGRLSEYQTLLGGFLEDRMKGVRGMKEDIMKRLQAVKRYLDCVQLDLMQGKCDWDFMVEKLKVLNRVSACSPIPMDIFHPATRLVKQGPVTIMVRGKETQKHLLLFTTHLSVANRLPDQRIQFTEDAMKSLTGATLHPMIDTAGQVIEPDFHSGLKEDMLGFRINLALDFFVVKVGKPNEKKAWIDSIERTLQQIQDTNEPDLPNEVIIPDEAPKIAAASLEKLFQQLTNPQIAYKEEFIEVFLNTYQCFTTPKDVLTALLNCIRSPGKEKTPDPTSSLQGSTNLVFTFNMDDCADTESSSMSASNSIQNLSGYDSDCSLTDSPILSRREMTNSSVSPKRVAKPASASSKDGIRTSVCTTDSDSSPYTSGVPVADNPNKEVEMGWNEAELSLTVHQHEKVKDSVLEKDESLRRESSNSLTFDQSLFYPSSQSRASNYSHDSGSIRYSDDDDDEVDSSGHHLQPFNPMDSVSNSMNELLDTDLMFQSVHESIRVTQEELMDSQHSSDGFVIVEHPRSPSNFMDSNHVLNRKHSSRMSEEIEEASRLCEEMLSNLSKTPDSRSHDGDEDCFPPEEDEMNFQRYTRGTRRSTETPSPSLMTNRLSGNLSLSEPDLAVLAVKGRKSLTESCTVSQRKNEDEDEDDLLTSLPATIARKFLEPSTPQHQRKDKQKGSRFRGFRGKKPKTCEERGRKSDPSNVPSRRHTLNQSSSLYFNTEIDRRGSVSPSKGLTGLFKKKDKDGKKIRKTPSMHGTGDMTDGAYPETPSRSRKTVRSSSVAPPTDRHVYINIDEFGELKKPARERNEDGSPQYKRKGSMQYLAFKNFSLAAKIFLVLGKWIDTHFEDFQDNPEMMDTLDDFIQEMLTSDCAESKLAEQLFTLVNQYKQKRRVCNPSLGDLMARFCKIDPKTAEDWGKPSRVLGSRTIDLGRSSNLKEPGFVKAFAEQLTLIEYSCYNAITRCEFLNCNWKKKEKSVLAPNICRLIQQTNELTSWICTEVLIQDSAACRAVVIEHFINIAMICYKHHDLHCALNIIMALGSASIKRLTKTWDALDRKARNKFEKLKDVTDPQEKCKKIREKLERVTAESLKRTNCIPSCLPYIGAYLDLIYSLDIGTKTCNSDGLVNFAKMTKLSSLINSVLMYQRTPYSFEPREEIIAYILSARRLSDNELYELSVVKEPSKR